MDQTIIDIQKKGILLHRMIYVIFALQRIVVQLAFKEIVFSNTIIILALFATCVLAEEICYNKNFFGKAVVARGLRYGQCLVTVVMFIFLHDTEGSDVMLISLFLLFMIDYLMCIGMADRSDLIFYLVTVCIPIVIILMIKMITTPQYQWMLLFFDVIILLFVIAVEAFSLVDYLNRIDRQISDQRNEFTEMVDQNTKIMSMQTKLKNTNMDLNVQKMDLQKANKQIKAANQEMMVQAEILRYIAMSFDVPKISNHIADAIMTVKKLGFCAVYIRENVYLNKHPNYVIKTSIDNIQDKVRNCMSQLYLEMMEKGEKIRILHEDIPVQFPFLKDENIHSVYINLLCLEDDDYGLFIIGDKHKDLFNDHMSFYDAVISQFDIAIGNAKIYNNMQFMSQKDSLTGINNRVHFNHLFKEVVDKINATNGCMSVALFDIDKFKNVNDTYGHLAGDEVIKRIASVTEACIDKYNGFVCRYGGEEFVTVLPERNLSNAKPVIEELFEELCRQVVVYNGQEIAMSVSVGLTAYPEVCDNPEELLKRADWCMYYAKEHGRHQINIDDGSIQRDKTE